MRDLLREEAIPAAHKIVSIFESEKLDRIAQVVEHLGVHTVVANSHLYGASYRVSWMGLSLVGDENLVV